MKRIPRSDSYELLHSPDRILKRFKGVYRIDEHDISPKRYTIGMIPRGDDPMVYLSGGELDVKRLCLLFGYDSDENSNKSVFPKKVTVKSFPTKSS